MASAARDTAGHSCGDDSCNDISFGGGSATPTTNDINESIPEWQGSIPFSVFVLDDITKDISSIFDRPPQNIDISHYLEAQQYPTRRLYFSPETYPPPANDEEMEYEKINKSVAWMSLKKDVKTAAHDAGSPVHGVGASCRRSTSENGGKRFRCSRCYKKSTYVAKPKKKRHPKSGKKRPKKELAEPKGLCKFGFTIKWDNFGFYVNLENRSGNPWHQNHRKSLQSMNTTSAMETRDVDSSISDAANLTDSADVKTSEALKELLESCCAMADEIGPEAIKKLEETLLGFQAWCNDRRLRESGEKKEAVATTTGKRKYTQ